MLILVVFDKQTQKVILCYPLKFDRVVYLKELSGLIYEGFDYAVFTDRKPVFYEDEDGDICIKENSFIINSKYLY